MPNTGELCTSPVPPCGKDRRGVALGKWDGRHNRPFSFYLYQLVLYIRLKIKAKIRHAASVSQTSDDSQISVRFRSGSESPWNYAAAFRACALTFAQRFFVAFTIAALPAADRTRFLTIVTSRPADWPNAFAAPRTRFNWCCSLPNCFSSFLSSRLIAARMSMNPPGENLPQHGTRAPDVVPELSYSAA
jgi:hypothetical protein